MPNLSQSRGNVLFLILIAVALFSALGYAVFGRGSGSQGNMTRERATAQAAQIIAYINSLKNGVDVMVTGNRCSEIDLDFGNDVWKTNDGSNTTAVNGSAPVSGKCSLFNANGGGQIPQLFLNSVSSDYPTTTGKIAAGHMRIGVSNVRYKGSNLNDLVVVLAGLDLEVCNQVIKQIGVTSTGSDCFKLSTTPTDYSFSVSPNTWWITGNVQGSIAAMRCDSSSHTDNPISVTPKSCYVAGVLLER